MGRIVIGTECGSMYTVFITVYQSSDLESKGWLYLEDEGGMQYHRICSRHDYYENSELLVDCESYFL